jgi:hypothetical protein
MKNSNPSNPSPAKLEGPEVLKLIEGCRGNMNNGIGVALMSSLSRINPELHASISGSKFDPSSNRMEMISIFFKEVCTETGYTNVPKTFKK